MFYAMWLVCLSVTNNCEEIVRTIPTLHKTEESCMEGARKTAQEIHLYFLQQNIQAQIGVKCVEDKNSI
jgi:hypothetical protein